MLRAVKWWMPVAAMTLLSLLSYVDRTILAQLSPTILRDEGLSAEQYGWIIDAFSVAYLVGSPVWGLRPRPVRGSSRARAGPGALDRRVGVARVRVDGGELRHRASGAGVRRGRDLPRRAANGDADASPRSACPGPRRRIQRRVARRGPDADHRDADRAPLGLARRFLVHGLLRPGVARALGARVARRAAGGAPARRSRRGSTARRRRVATSATPDRSVGVGVHGRLRVRRAAARLRAVRRSRLSGAAPGLGPGDARARALGAAARMGDRATSSGGGSSTERPTRARGSDASSGASSRSSPRLACRWP